MEQRQLLGEVTPQELTEEEQANIRLKMALHDAIELKTFFYSKFSTPAVAEKNLIKG